MPFLQNRNVKIFLTIFVLLASGVVFLYFTNEDVAMELQQVRQPVPNNFFVGLDVSATISTDTLEKLKEAIIGRLEQFLGDPAVSYTVMTFGNPGCGSQSLNEVVNTASPQDQVAFNFKVAEPIRSISITKVAPRDTTPLTTPFYHFLDTILPPRIGGRVIIFSDMMNDDSDCERQYIFPEDSLIEFGKNKNGQIIFLYALPTLTDNTELNQRLIDKQQEFIDRMKAMNAEGKIRVYFYQIPEDPLERLGFIRSQLQNAIPTTAFDVVWERTSRVFSTIVSAVRG